MTKQIKPFPIRPVQDCIIIERLNIMSVPDKKFKEHGLILPSDSGKPKNIMDIENQKAAEYVKYEGAEAAMSGQWDEHPNQGIVMAVGMGRYIEQGVHIPIEVKPGDHIYYRGRTGEPIIVNKKIYWVIKEYDVFGVVR